MNADTLAWTIARYIATDPVLNVHASSSAMTGGVSTLVHDRIMPVIEEAMRAAPSSTHDAAADDPFGARDPRRYEEVRRAELETARAEVREFCLRGQLMRDQYGDLDRAARIEIDRLTGALGEMTLARVAAEDKLATITSAMQNDIAATLRALGLSDLTRRMSLHEVIIDDVIPNIERVVAEMKEANSERLTDAAIDDLRGQLAALCHQQWSGWMHYLFGKCHNTAKGEYSIQEYWAERWKRQMNATYAQLSPEEEDSDRAEADKFIAMIRAARGQPEPATEPNFETSADNAGSDVDKLWSELDAAIGDCEVTGRFADSEKLVAEVRRLYDLLSRPLGDPATTGPKE